MATDSDRLQQYRERYEDLEAPAHDGIKDLPDKPGIYCILNRVTGRRYVGLTKKSMRRRALQHRSLLKRGLPDSMLMMADLKRHGYESFVFFTLFWLGEVSERRTKDFEVLGTERYWAVQLGAHLEGSGYNLDVGGLRTAGSRFRDQETKLMRSRSYALLPHVQMYDPIAPVLLSQWVPGR